MYKKSVRRRHNCMQCRTWKLIMHTGSWRYLHRTILAPTAYQTRKYNHTFRISARPPIARSQQIIFDISKVKPFRELQKSRSIRQEAARCSPLKRTAHKRKIQHPVTFVFPVIGKTKNSRRAKFKTKKQETKTKDKEKNSFVFRVSGFCTNAVNGV